jgi:S-formylglutathione hydrolase
VKVLKTHACEGGSVRFWEHESKVTGTAMKFSTFTPPGEVAGALIWLSGLTCNEENFITKAGAQRWLAEEKIMVICPDTSPRGLNLPGEHDAYDFGSGAGFYVDATTEGYRDHYRMHSYVNQELYGILQKDFEMGERISISGHSMGGHGALVFGLREPKKFKSVSAFSPIVNPTAVPWGEKALTGYLGEDRKAWAQYDATELIKAGKTHPHPLLIDQGTKDDFLANQLKPENLQRAAEGKQKVTVRLQEGYDHSYYFISTFIRDHVEFHANHLKA